jgi:uncharacterized protein YjbI with pentapeptide repeats
VLAALGITSVLSFATFWKTVCPILRLCDASAEQRVKAAVSQSDAGLRSNDIQALMSLARDKDEARVVLGSLTAFVREKRRRQPGDECTTTMSSIPGDVQAAVSVLIVASRTAVTSLTLDTLNLAGVDLRKADIRGAAMNGACLARAVLDSANVRGGHFDGAELPGAFLRNALVDSASFEGARLDGARLREASLIAVNMSEVRAEGTDFGFSHLQCALFGNATLASANFSFADLRWAYFGGATVGRAQNLIEADSVRHATFDGALGLPPPVARTLRERGALLEKVDELTWYQPRLAQMAPDSACFIR